MTISMKKTEVMQQPVLYKPYVEPVITIKGQTLKAVDKCTYPGTTLSRDVHIDDERNSYNAKAWNTFNRLTESIWESRNINLNIKLKVYQAVIILTLLYAKHGQSTTAMPEI